MLGAILKFIVSVVFFILTLPILLFSYFVSWFLDREEEIKSDPNKIPFSYKKEENIEEKIGEKIESGDFTHIQGIFNKKTNKVEDAVGYNAKDVDENVKNSHKNNNLVIYS